MKISKLVVFVLLLHSLEGFTKEIENREQSVPKGEIISYGIYEIEEITSTVELEHSTAGKMYTGKFKHLKTTDKVPVKKDIVFGVKIRLTGLYNNDVVPLIEELKHPLTKDHEGKESIGYSSHVNLEKDKFVFEDYFLYQLTESYEMLPGKWEINYYYGDQKLVGKSFILYDE